MDLGENQGWLVDALEVQCRNDIIKFIYQNGGACTSVHCIENDYVLGGQSNDMRILNHKNAVNLLASENANADTNSSECGYIHKWTLVFSFVSKWLQRMKDVYEIDELRQVVLDEDQGIKKAFSELLASTDEHKI